MKDIGSIFSLSAEEISLKNTCISNSALDGNRINFSLCREALYAIAQKYGHSEKTVLLPAYTCQTVIDPFVQQGWKCYYYNINLNLRIDTEDLLHKYQSYHSVIVVVHPYYGMELDNEELKTLYEIKTRGAVLIEDITQCIYTHSRPEIFDYFTGSYRKWCKVPDGGFIESNILDDISIPEECNDSFVSRQVDAMYLREKYFETNDELIKSISIKLNKEAVLEISGMIKCHKMSDFSLKIMKREEKDLSNIKRFNNYKYLFDNISQTEDIKFVCSDISKVTTPPLYFPIYVLNRTKIQEKFAQRHIYAPILWPVNTEDLLLSDDIKFIYSHILMIPIDQRYDEEDMKRIVELFKEYE